MEYDLNQYKHSIKCIYCKEYFKPYFIVHPQWHTHVCPACNEFNEGLTP